MEKGQGHDGVILMSMTSSSLSVSALIITFNEEKHIERCLASLAWADEILVVDAFSRDRTPEICLRKDAPWSGKLNFIQKEWEGFRVQRNFALEKAKNNWLLVVDADEECTPVLAARIKELLMLPEGPPRRAYKIRRIEYFLGKPIHYGIWNDKEGYHGSYQDRFFHREGVYYVNDVHEYPVFQQKPGIIHEPLHHASITTEKFLDKMNKYTTIEAQDRIDQGKRTNLLHILVAFPAMFIKNYIRYKSYRDGIYGVIISLLEGVSRVVRHIKMWQIQQGKKW
ncbi:MAG: glycosyltransferase family 2 protein [Nitrospirota bacterium]